MILDATREGGALAPIFHVDEVGGRLERLLLHILRELDMVPILGEVAQVLSPSALT